MRYAAFLILTLGLALAPVAAEDRQEASVDRIFSEYAKPGSPGCAVGIIRNGGFVYRHAYGSGSLELGVPLSHSSVFYMGSVSKQFTAASVVLAAEQGYLSLDDDVRKYIPELPDYGRPITLRQMLHHTSGLRDFLSLLNFAGRDGSDIHGESAIIDLLARQKALNNVPGERFIYSNSNYFLLGVVVKRATGKSLAEFAEQNIFHPLGMTHTRFYDDHTLVLPGRVSAYDAAEDGTFLVDWSTGYDLVGGGGLTSSVDDMLLWDRNFYANKLGKGTLVSELQSRGTLNNGKQISYALGLELGEYRGQPIVEHSGALFGYRTEILRFPRQQFTVVCLCNVSNAGVTNLARKVADFYLEHDLRPVPGGEKKAVENFPDPSPYAGKYLDEQNHFVYTFSASNGELTAWGARLLRVAANQFHDLGTGTITFSEHDGKMRAALEMDGEMFFSGEKVAAPELSAADLSAYTGRYQSSEVDAEYNVSINSGKLALEFHSNAPIPMDYVASDEFESPSLGNIVFHRDGNRKVTGFSMYEVRARGMRFGKVN